MASDRSHSQGQHPRWKSKGLEKSRKRENLKMEKQGWNQPCGQEGDPKMTPDTFIYSSLGGQLEVEGELNVETKTGWNWFDDLFSFYVNAEGNLGISVGASAGGNYYADSAGTCELSGSGFEVGCVSAGEGTFSGSVVFEIKNTNYSAGFDIGLWDGWDNGKCD